MDFSCRSFARAVARRAALAAVAALGLAAALHPAPVGAQTAASPWIDYGQGRARLLSASENAAGDLVLGLHYDIAPGWEIYWRSPGEAGFPTTIVWTGSDNFADPALQWPRPDRFEIFELETFGYKNEVVLPIAARQARPGEPVAIRAEVNFLTCEEICVPHTLTLALDLPTADAGGPLISPHAPLINKYRSRVPRRDGGLGLTVERAEIVTAADGQFLQVVARAETRFAAPDVYVEAHPAYVFAKPKVRLTDDGRRAVLQAGISQTAVARDAPPPLLGSALTLTLVDGPQAVERTLTATLGQGEAATFLPLIAILGLALLGGLILNVMPCVLPVLSIKLLAAVSHGGGDPRPVRRSFLASAAGVVFAFLVLAGVLIGLRIGGAAIGWGIQFQQPLFIVVMTVVVTLFAANMWGLFTLRLPAWIGGAAGRPAASPHGVGSSFASGMFATVLATPCSAPFLGTAVGFALARGPVEIAAIFVALGLGMAAPFLLVAALPRLATKLPRPGRWMTIVKNLLGVALLGTAVWLLSILAFQVSPASAYFLAALMALAVGILFVRTRLPAALRPAAVVAVAVLAVLSIAAPQVGNTVARAEDDNDEIWQAFDPAAIPALVADGKVVFVDVTAEWCITCLVNKRLVLNRGTARALLNDPDVVAMRADWTNPDARIARYLAGFNRFGIPFNVVYGPVAPNGLTLPEILQEGIVVETFLQASGRNVLADGS